MPRRVHGEPGRAPNEPGYGDAVEVDVHVGRDVDERRVDLANDMAGDLDAVVGHRHVERGDLGFVDRRAFLGVSAPGQDEVQELPVVGDGEPGPGSNETLRDRQCRHRAGRAGSDRECIHRVRRGRGERQLDGPLGVRGAKPRHGKPRLVQPLNQAVGDRQLGVGEDLLDLGARHERIDVVGGHGRGRSAVDAVVPECDRRNRVGSLHDGQAYSGIERERERVRAGVGRGARLDRAGQVEPCPRRAGPRRDHLERRWIDQDDDVERHAPDISGQLLTVRQPADPHQLGQKVRDNLEADADGGVRVSQTDLHLDPRRRPAMSAGSREPVTGPSPIRHRPDTAGRESRPQARRSYVYSAPSRRVR